MGLAVVIAGYAWLWDGDGRLRYLYFALGVLTVWLALQTPIDTLGDHYLQSVHMLQHVLLGVVAPPLLLLGLSDRMARVLRGLLGFHGLVRPLTAQLVAAAVMIVWHIPAAYDAALRSEGVHIFEHLTFIGAGLIFWWPVLRATARQEARPLTEGMMLVYLLLGTVAQDGVSLVLQFSRTPFYDFYVNAPRLLPGIDPVVDQNIAGTVLMLAGKTSYAVAAIAIFLRWAARERAEDGLIPAR